MNYSEPVRIRVARFWSDGLLNGQCRKALLRLTMFLMLAPIVYAEENIQAFMLASQSENRLLPEDGLIERITHELSMVYRTVPAVAKLRLFSPWTPGKVILGLEKGGKVKLAAGELEEVSAANEKYGPVTKKPFRSLEAVTLTFAKPYNADELVKVYSQLPGVKYAEADRMVGDGDRVVREVKSREIVHYTFSKGWGDCPSGCIHRHFWEIQVEDKKVTLIKEHGDPLP